MIRPFLTGLTLICLAAASAPSLLARHPAAHARHVQKEQLSFNNTLFELAFEETNRDISIKEFLLSGETLDNWTQLVSIQKYHRASNPRIVAERMISLVQEQHPQVSTHIVDKAAEHEVLLDYVIENGRWTEFHLFRLFKDRHGDVEVYQYAMRTDRHARRFLDNVKSNRVDLIRLLESRGFEIP